MRKMTAVAQRVLGESDEITLKMRWNYARALCEDPAATLDDLREAVTTLEENARMARRVLGSAHPVALDIRRCLLESWSALRARETPSPVRGSIAPAVLRLAFAVVIVLCLAWGASTAPAPRAPEL